jgi:hypothetical protein
MCVEGKHEWSWDGYSDDGILDTKLLKASAINFEFNAKRNGLSSRELITLRAEPANEDWVDIAIDKKRKDVQVELRLNVKDSGAEGVGELPPAEIQNFPTYKQYNKNDPRRRKHLRAKSFNDLKWLLFSGMKRYWSRNVKVANNVTYAVKMMPVLATKKAMDDISVKYNTNREWSRSSNPGSVRGFYSFFGNLAPERIAYNVGWIEYQNGWSYQQPFDADQEFAETSAHEIGHEILSAYGGDAYSYGHRNSSTIITQRTKPVSNGGVRYPASGQIDLMKYYNGNRPRNFFSRVYASEQDVKSLLWLARVHFNE